MITREGMAKPETDLPILFSGAMVRAILDGSKTMTRRLLREEPAIVHVGKAWRVGGDERNGIIGGPFGRTWHQAIPTRFRVGRCAWVRETFYDDNGLRHTEPTPTASDEHIYYRADGEPQWEADGPTAWSPSIHMPRWASRIDLIITAHRVERLQDITEEDARAEGLPGDASLRPSGWDPDGDDWNAGTTAHYIAAHGDPGTPVGHFRHVWSAISGKRAPWDSNPFVEVVSFGRVQ